MTERLFILKIKYYTVFVYMFECNVAHASTACTYGFMWDVMTANHVILHFASRVECGLYTRISVIYM